MNIVIKTFLRDRCIDRVLKINAEKNILPCLELYHCSEIGFSLPWNDFWREQSFKNKDLALKYHNCRNLRFVYKYDKIENDVFDYWSDNEIIGLRFKDDCNYWSDDELMKLKLLINESLCTLKCFEFTIDCRDILDRYGLEEYELLENLNPNIITEILKLIPSNAIIGDIIQTIPQNERSRNEGTMIITERGLRKLFRENGLPGTIHPSLKVGNGSFNPEYWIDAISNNTIIFLDELIIEMINKNRTKKLSHFTINGKLTYFFIINDIGEIVEDFNGDDIISIIRQNNGYFEYSDDCSFLQKLNIEASSCIIMRLNW